MLAANPSSIAVRRISASSHPGIAARIQEVPAPGKDERPALPATALCGHQQAGGAGADRLRQRRRPARLEIELDPELAEPGKLLPAPRIGHAVDEPDRRGAEMSDAGFDAIGLAGAQRAADPEHQLERRIAAALAVHI